MNLNDEVQRERLFRSMTTSYQGMQPARSLNRALVDEYTGSGYGTQNRPKFETMVNLMNQTVDAYTMGLVANRPRVLLSTPQQHLSYFARQFQLAINNLIEEIGLEFTLKQWVLDAFFSVGIVKIHMGDAGAVMLENDLRMDPGTPFASNVSLDNWVYDASATNWYQMKFAGDMYRIPHADLKSDIYDQAAVRGIMPNSKYDYDPERLKAITQGVEVDQDEFEPSLDLCDVWIAREQRVYTFVVKDARNFRAEGKPIADMPWNGPEFGTYHKLGFNDVPENILPVSPASHLSSMSRLINNIMRKNSKRARSAKRVHTYTAQGAKSAESMKSASDDQFILVNDPNEVGEHQIGGVDPTAQQFVMGVVDLYDRMAGNLTAMMGLGAQADTVGQEQLIHSAVSKKEAQMQYRVVDGARRIIRDLGHMLWHDKLKVIRGQIPVEGANGYFVDATWTPEDREGDFFDYNFNIDLFSMPYQSPSQKLQAINTIVTSVYAPMMQGIMAQGGQLNFQKLNEIYSEFMNEPRMQELLQFTNIPANSTPGVQDRNTPLPTATTRNYVRRSVSTGGTAQGRSIQQQQAWASLANQSSNNSAA